MAMSRGTIIFMICLFMVCGLWVEDTNASTLGYGALGGGNIHADCKMHPEAPSCYEAPANKYTRGCEKETDCHKP
ncbi:hypothetical protein I3760_04G146500 [Carya illinoinensis]|nr:hypothetical protein I3760_04G146500 [Carya illinoinensis]